MWRDGQKIERDRERENTENRHIHAVKTHDAWGKNITTTTTTMGIRGAAAAAEAGNNRKKRATYMYPNGKPNNISDQQQHL